jgi:spermidine synthase
MRASEAPRASGFLLLSTAFVVGAATMMAELAASRLVAPFYGTSTPVWALLIGAVLASLALGQALGGRLSRVPARVASTRPLGLLLLAAALLLALLPFVAAPVMGGSLSWFRRGDLGLLGASFLGVTALLALPLVSLGACGPLLLHLCVTTREEAGAVAGRVYALGTTGSLVGTYLSGLLLIPWIGTRATLFVGAASLGVLGLVALLGDLHRRATLGGVLGLLLLAALGLAFPGGPIHARKGAVYEAETACQYLQVVETRGARWLYLNEGYAVQSVLPMDGSLPTYGVWGYYALSPAWTRGGPPARVLLLGLGGGSSARSLHRLYPEAEITGVELDPEVVEVGRRFFDMPAELRVITDDARAALHRAPLAEEGERYDLIVVDAFQFPYIPFQLCTLEFFAELEARLAEGGALVLNVGRDRDAHDVVDAIARTLAEVLPQVRGVDVPELPNTMLVGTRHPATEDAGLAGLRLPEAVAAELRRLPSPSTWTPAPDAPILTDDRAPVEGLTDRVLLRRLWITLRDGGWAS